jgi:hypothetical protein
MTGTDVLRYDADDARIGDRIAASGWALPRSVTLVKKEASGMTVFANGPVSYGPPRTTVGVVVDGQEAESRRVVLDDDYLVAEGPSAGTVEPSQAVLDEFVRLAADPSDQELLGYARRHGMLGVRPRGRLEARMVFPHVPWVGEQLAPSIGYELAPGSSREPLGLWRRVLREIHAAYTIAARLRNDQVVERAAWVPLRGVLLLPLGPNDAPEDEPEPVTIDGFPGLVAVPWIPVDSTTLDGQRAALAAVIGAWLAIGAVRPVIAWGGPSRLADPVMALGATTLFGGLVLELLLAVAGQAGIAICAACGGPHVPGRRPRQGSSGAPPRSYCPACRAKNAPQNAAAKRWRDRNPDYHRLHRAARGHQDPVPKGASPKDQ